MKRRIRKKKLKQEIDRLNQIIIKKLQKLKSIKDDKTVNGLIAKTFLPMSSFGIQMKIYAIKKKIKDGKY